MLTEVCDFIHNYFEISRHDGEFEIANGQIDLEGLILVGQRFRICGSALNDGIYTYRVDGIYNDDDTELAELTDEIFEGIIYGMGGRGLREVLKISEEITAWQEKNRTALESPYQSESFGGYSYTKAVGSGANAGGALSWRDVFGSRLNAYRKIS